MRSISINAHAASIDAAVARKEAFAQEVAAAGRRLNVSGFTLDFEDGNGDHIDEWVSLWSTVRDALHPHGMTLGNCVCEDVWLKPNATGSQNYGGANQTAWAFLWDIKPQVPVFDFLTDMSTYVSHATAISPPRPLGLPCRANGRSDAGTADVLRGSRRRRRLLAPPCCAVHLQSTRLVRSRGIRG